MMETWDLRRTVWLVVLMCVSAVAALYWAALAQRPVGSDAEQIRALLVRGERALEERNVAAAMGLVSQAYRDDQGLRYGSLRMLGARHLRSAQSVEITMPNRLLRILVEPDGRHAVASARVDVRVATRFDTEQELSANVAFRFAKEPVRHYLLFPGHEWHIVRMEGWQGLVPE